MRVTNTKMTNANAANPSNRIAKRAVFLALLVASSSTASGQSPSGGPSHSRFQNTISVPKIVREGAKITPIQQAGAVRSNPFVSASQPGSDAALATTGQDAPNAGLRSSQIGESRDSAVAAPGPSAHIAGITFSPQGAGSVRENPLFNRASSVPFATADQVVKDTSNAFVRQRRKSLTGVMDSSGLVRSTGSPVPMTYSPESAAPIPPGGVAGTSTVPNEFQAALIAASASELSYVVPVADARDSQDSIRETQPIFFTLSDDSEESTDISSKGTPASNTEDSSAKLDTLQPRGTQDQRQSDAVAEALETDEAVEQIPTIENEAKSAVDTETEPEVEPAGESGAHSDVAASTQVDGDGDGDGATQGSTKPQINDDTPVKLAPALDFTKSATVPSQPSSEHGSEIGVNPKVADLKGQDQPSEVDDLVISNRSPAPVVAKTPSVSNTIQTETTADGITVTVKSPPIKIERSDVEEGFDFSPVGVAAVDPTQAPIFAEPPPRVAQQHEIESSLVDTQGSAEGQDLISVRGQNKSTGPVAAMPATVPDVRSAEPLQAIAPPSDAPVALSTVGPMIEDFGIGEAPLIGAPVAVDPTQAKGSPQHTSDGLGSSVMKTASDSSTGTPARLASSRQPVRRAADNDNQATTQQDAALPESTDSPRPDASKNAVVLQLSRAQVRSMTIGGTLKNLSVADTDICQAIASGANQIKLIGTGIGRTELTIWADVTAGEPTRVQTFVIEVNEAVNATGGKVTGHTELLNDSIDKAFPTASVVVAERGGELVVTGHCDDEETAKQIIRMVRKICLVPVQDNLKVR